MTTNGTVRQNSMAHELLALKRNNLDSSFHRAPLLPESVPTNRCLLLVNYKLTRADRFPTDDAAEKRHVEGPVTHPRTAESLDRHRELQVVDDVEVRLETDDLSHAAKADRAIPIHGPTRDLTVKVSRERVAHMVDTIEVALGRSIG